MATRGRRRKNGPVARMARPGESSGLERRLRNRLRGRISVEVHDNTHTMVTFRKAGGGWALRLHHMFLTTSERELDALVAFITGSDPAASAALDRFIEANRGSIRRISASQRLSRVRIEARGKHHDLGRIFARLNRRYFQGRVRAAITWGPNPPGVRPRKSLKMGSYSAESRIIRIHPVLDRAWVPGYFVEWIVFHEMLHQIHPARKLADGRLAIHTPEFAAHEQIFHALARARDWEIRHLARLLRAG
jgi:hypothetical protein